MWRNHPFSQRNKTTERELGLGVGGGREWGAGGTKLKRARGRQYMRGFHEIGEGGLTPVPTMTFQSQE